MAIRLEVGLVLESKDTDYEPGRQIRLEALLPEGTDPADAVWRCVCVAHPRRPNRIGSVTLIRATTLRKRWCAPQ